MSRAIRRRLAYAWRHLTDTRVIIVLLAVSTLVAIGGFLYTLHSNHAASVERRNDRTSLLMCVATYEESQATAQKARTDANSKVDQAERNLFESASKLIVSMNTNQSDARLHDFASSLSAYLTLYDRLEKTRDTYKYEAFGPAYCKSLTQ